MAASLLHLSSSVHVFRLSRAGKLHAACEVSCICTINPTRGARWQLLVPGDWHGRGKPRPHGRQLNEFTHACYETGVCRDLEFDTSNFCYVLEHEICLPQPARNRRHMFAGPAFRDRGCFSATHFSSSLPSSYHNFLIPTTDYQQHNDLQSRPPPPNAHRGRLSLTHTPPTIISQHPPALQRYTTQLYPRHSVCQPWLDSRVSVAFSWSSSASCHSSPLFLPRTGTLTAFRR